MARHHVSCKKLNEAFDGAANARCTCVERKSVSSKEPCPSHPEDGERHECMKTEMRCAYCGVRLDPYPCHGCGKFLTAEEMSGEGLSSEGTRCDECA